MDTQTKNTVVAPVITSDHKKIGSDLRSESAQEIINSRPGFLERWALALFLAVLFSALTASWFIRSPDIIIAKARLTASNAPKEIIPWQSGRLVKLLMHNDEQVKKDQAIGWIESTASHKEVLNLSVLLDSCLLLLEANETGNAARLFHDFYGNLGELQAGYQQFITAWQQFNDYSVNGFYIRKKAHLQKDIVALREIYESLTCQKMLVERGIQLAATSFRMNSLLANDKVISQDEFRAEESKYVDKQLSLPRLNTSLLQNETQQREKQKEIEQLDHDMAQQRVIFEQAIKTLQSKTDNWIKRYILRSPIEGKIVFIAPLQENQFLQQGKLLAYVNPVDTRFYAEAYLPQNNFGKVDTGQTVQLRFDAYPYQEFGFIKGSLSYVSKVAYDSGFLAIIRLDEGLVTNYHKTLHYKSGLNAEALVITQNMRLLQRLYYNIQKNISDRR